jgi:anti-sigma factor RsiW
MDCRRAEDLLSDHLEGTLPGDLRADLEAHLRECASCAALRETLGGVVAALRGFPTLEPAQDLAERAASRALLAGRRVAARPSVLAFPRPAPHARGFVPSWIQAAAAGVALVLAGTLLLLAGPEGPSHAAARLVDRTVHAGNYLLARSDRLVEDVRVLGVAITTAFEGRLDRVNDRVEDYKKRLERRRGPEDDARKRESGLGRPVRSADGFRTARRGDT